MVSVFPGGRPAHKHAALKAAIFAYADEPEMHTHIYADCLPFRPSALHPMIPVDSSRRVTAGSETKLEQRQVTPSRSHVFLKTSIPPFFPPQGTSEICLCVLNFWCHLVLWPIYYSIIYTVYKIYTFTTSTFAFPMKFGD